MTADREYIKIETEMYQNILDPKRDTPLNKTEAHNYFTREINKTLLILGTNLNAVWEEEENREAISRLYREINEIFIKGYLDGKMFTEKIQRKYKENTRWKRFLKYLKCFRM